MKVNELSTFVSSIWTVQFFRKGVKYFFNYITILHLTSSIGAATVSETAYNETNFTLG